MKKKLLRVALLATLLLAIIGTFSVSALTPYSTYTYDVFGNPAKSPDAYVPWKVIDTNTIVQSLKDEAIPNAAIKYDASNFTAINTPKDVFVDNLNHIYIADTENNRILALDENGNLRTIISTFVNSQGVQDSLTKPAGVYVTDTEIYVADTDNARIVIFDKIGNFVHIVPQPKSEVFPEASVYKPIAVAVDQAGRIYVVSSTTNYGVISINRDGSFNSFIGPQKVSYNAFQIFWRAFQTEEQIAKSVKYVPTEYNNVTIDSSGFLYVTTSSIDAEKQQSAITSRSRADTYAPVKKLNPSGSDVMNRTGFYPPSGEVTVNNMATAENSISGASTIVDVALGPCGMWSIIDQKRSKVYTYDEDGNLLFIFGDIGDQIGQISNVSLCSIAYQGSNILLLDKTTGSIAVYKRTKYGDLIASALQNKQDRQYEKAVDYYISILQYNNNYDSAYVGIGQNLYNDGEYVSAMKYYKYAYDTENYSDAFTMYRKDLIEKYIYLVPIVIIVLCVAISKFNGYAKRKNKKGQVYKEKRSLWEEFIYGFHVIYHPFDGYWDLKHEKRGSIKGATLILVITILAFLYQALGKGYLFNPYYTGISFVMEIASVALPVALWVLSNWCLTTLFDGEGSLKDVYVTTCYALLPLPMMIVPATILSNVLTLDEQTLMTLLISIGFIWAGMLIFFGMMVIHDYSIGKNILTTIGAVVGMAFIMFVGILFTGLIQKVFYFGYNIYVELSYSA